MLPTLLEVARQGPSMDTARHRHCGGKDGYLISWPSLLLQTPDRDQEESLQPH